MRPHAIPVSGFEGTRGRRIFARVPGAGVSVRAAGAVTEIEVIGEIGFDVTVADFRQKLRGAGDLKLVINSPGGNAFDGIAIFNSAVGHAGRVSVEVIGVAASAASIIAMAGDEIAIGANAHLMIHRAWGVTVGNTDDHADQAELLARIDRSMAETYARRSGQSIDEMIAAMSAETWLTGDEAIEVGLADTLLGEQTTAAAFDLSAYANAPTELRAQQRRPALTLSSRSELERLLHSAGLSREASKRVAAGGYSALNKAGDQDDELESFTARVAAFNQSLRMGI